MSFDTWSETEDELLLSPIEEVDAALAVIVGTPVEPTRLYCGQCNEPYAVGDDLRDDALLSMCGGCAHRSR